MPGMADHPGRSLPPGIALYSDKYIRRTGLAADSAVMTFYLPPSRIFFSNCQHLVKKSHSHFIFAMRDLTSFRMCFFLMITCLLSATGLLISSCKNPAPDNLPVSIVAHRGAMMEKPENTMPAFQRAYELGVDIVEVDVRTSRDGHLFVLHDATLDRTTNATGPASQLTLVELQSLDAGSWFHPAYAGETIPTLRQVLEWARAKDLQVLLDLKESGSEFTEAVSRSIERHGDVNRNIIGVRSVEQALDFRRRIPQAPQLAFMRSPDLIEEFADAGTDVIRLWLRWLHEVPELALRVRNTGKMLMINGRYGEPEETQAIMSFQPDWILIDDPARLRRSLQEREAQLAP